MTARIIRFKDIPFLLALRNVQCLKVEECNGIMWLLALTVSNKFCPQDFAVKRATLFGADWIGRFSVQGEIVLHERMNGLDQSRSTVRLCFRSTQEDVSFLERVSFYNGDSTRSNIRYLAFPQAMTKFQLENQGFDIALTAGPIPNKRTHPYAQK